MRDIKFDVTPGKVVEINYDPGPTAVRAHNSTARVKSVWGPVRTGKSVFGCWRVFLKAKEMAEKGVPLKAVVVRDTYRNLEDTTMKTWDEWFGQCGTWVTKQGIKDFHLRTPGFDKPHEVLFRHGQTANDASSFLSSDYGVIWLEEVAPAFTPSGMISPGIAEEVFDLGLTRLIQKGCDNPELLITCNPPTPQHWVYRRIIGIDPEQLRKLNWWHFFFPAAENEKNLRAGYYDELRVQLAGKDHILKRFVEGEIVAIYPGMPIFASDFKQATHVRNSLTWIPEKPLILGFDAGLTPACLVTQIDANGRWLWLKEYQAGYVDNRLSEQMGAKRFSQMIKQDLAERFPGAVIDAIYSDPAAWAKQQTDEKTVKEVLEAEGLGPVLKGEVDIESGVEAIRQRLQSLVNGEPSILISRSGCPLGIEALSGGYRYGVSADATRLHGSTPLKDMYSHMMDAARYPASILFPVGYPFGYINREPEVEGIEKWNPFA